MKKIMFNDRYGLTQAVLSGRKTMTRRIIKGNGIVQAGEIQTVDIIDGVVHLVENNYDESCNDDFGDDDDGHIALKLPYEVGEVVAIAQKYSEISWDRTIYDKLLKMCDGLLPQYTLAGWDNKMFVKADLMPHHICINDIKVEHLQDITEEDSIKEGVKASKNYNGCYVAGISKGFDNPREAFAALIDKVSGRGTWERNPWVFAYEFELVD